LLSQSKKQSSFKSINLNNQSDHLDFLLQYDNSLYFVDEGFLYFVNKIFFVYFVDKMILTSHKPGDIIFNNDLQNC
jgi:hypothetical protein